jgi:hypothetical protein
MKTIRSLMTLAGLSLVLFALSATGAKGQILHSTHFAGTFTLPFEAQWGKMTLPAGDYTLEYGLLNGGGPLVVVRGKAEGSPSGIILAGASDGTSAAKNAIVCIRNGNTLVVRALEMPAIGESANFALPHGAQLEARSRNHRGYTQLAEAPMLVERIAVALNAK